VHVSEINEKNGENLTYFGGLDRRVVKWGEGGARWKREVRGGTVGKKNLKFVVEGEGVAVSLVLSLWVGVAARGRRWVGGEGRWRWRQRFGEILGENERGRDIRQISF